MRGRTLEIFRCGDMPRGEDARRMFRSFNALLGTPHIKVSASIKLERKTEEDSRIERSSARPARNLTYFTTISILARLTALVFATL